MKKVSFTTIVAVCKEVHEDIPSLLKYNRDGAEQYSTAWESPLRMSAWSSALVYQPGSRIHCVDSCLPQTVLPMVGITCAYRLFSVLSGALSPLPGKSNFWCDDYDNVVDLVDRYLTWKLLSHVLRRGHPKSSALLPHCRLRHKQWPGVNHDDCHLGEWLQLHRPGRKAYSRSTYWV